MGVKSHPTKLKKKKLVWDIGINTSEEPAASIFTMKKRAAV
jgi:hypothetical protein